MRMAKNQNHSIVDNSRKRSMALFLMMLCLKKTKLIKKSAKAASNTISVTNKTAPMFSMSVLAMSSYMKKATKTRARTAATLPDL